MDRATDPQDAGPKPSTVGTSSPPTVDELARLAGLLGFARGLLQASGRTLHRMRSTGLGCFDEGSLVGLPGLSLDRDDGTWLHLARLRAEPAPRPPDELMAWFVGFDRTSSAAPAPEPVLLKDVPIDVASDLCEGGLLALDDIHEFEPGAVTVRIVLRLDRLHELHAAIGAWVDGEWAAWAGRQRPVLASIEVYEKLFGLHNRMNGGAETPPELVWGTGVATWRDAGVDIEMPLIEQLVDLELEDDGALVITSRARPPAVNLAPFHEADAAAGKRARSKLDATLTRLLDEGDGTLSPFVPTDVEPLLLQAASLLAMDGRCITRAAMAAGETRRGPGETLEIVSSWVLYARPRTVGARADDLQRLAETTAAASGEGSASVAVPPGLVGFVRDLSDSVPDAANRAPTSTPGEGAPGGERGGERGSERGSERGETASSGRRDGTRPTGIGYYFPLAWNEEQARIIDELERSPVVTVTGPPGTGKTHTIANIVSHYMATGRRVLVTARTAEAIAAVREKLPPELASLVIASVGSDREGTRQLEEAIERLSDEVVSLDETAVRESVQRLEASIAGLDAERANLERDLAAIAAENLAPLEWDGTELSAMEVALRLAAEGPVHAWFEDRPDGPPPATLDAVIDELRETLPGVADDLAYLRVELPIVANIPGTGELLDVHRAVQAQSVEPARDVGEQPAMARDTLDADQRAGELLVILARAEAKFDSLEPWVRTAIGHEVSALASGRQGSSTFDPLLAMADRFGSASPGELRLDATGLDMGALNVAVDKACAGGKPLSVFERFGNKKLAHALDELRIDGSEPVGEADWQRVRDTLRVAAMRAELVDAWEHASRRLPLPGLPPSLSGMVDAVRDVTRWHAKIVRAARQVVEWVEPLEVLFPFDLDIRGSLGRTDFEVIVRALQANLETAPADAGALDRLAAFADAGTLPLHQAFRALHGVVADAAVPEREIMRRRGELTFEIARLQERRPELERAATLLRNIASNGAPAWSAALEADPGKASALLPMDWRKAWSRARTHARLERIRALGNGDEHLVRKRELAVQRQHQLCELIRARTLVGLRPRMSESVRSALISFMTAVRRYGRGTGAQAGRWRRDMMRSATEASRAAPVWIMPEYKIAEQLPSELASFDLVVLDEASQCDITSIASLARGARCLIVGDEKQVSPSSVGIPIQRIDVLRAEHLAGLPTRNGIDQDTSIFDLACRMYPSSHLMLREHFRCVEPIIRFSTRFYQDRLIPLRVPRPSERFDPPLVDVHVAGASRDGILNRAEACVIVDEIAVLVSDPVHARRDIAVISLIGTKQAEEIEKRLIKDPRIGTEAMKRHAIICGDARTLQGQERSIVFLSMVAVPDARGNVMAQSSRDVQQRMNVAMSRACDRLYLVRSVTLDNLKPGDIKSDVLRHFQDPMPDGGAEASADLLERCDSGFERDVCTELMNAGYRVRAQVKAGPFRIDLVVEGENDRRLAIELDGDRWHGPDVWERDMRRQASLERAGWTFWRVFGSQWVGNRAHHWNDLVDTLGRLGIEPIGAAATGERFSELREFVVDGDGVRTVGAEARRGDSMVDDKASDQSVTSALPAVDDIDVTSPVERAASIAVDIRDAAIDGDRADLDEQPRTDEVEIGDALPRPEPSVEASFVPPPSDPSLLRGETDIEADEDTVGETNFYADAYRSRLGDRLCEIVDTDGPTDFDELCRRVAAEHGLRRTGHVIRETIRGALADRRALTASDTTDHETVWPEGAMPGPRLTWVEPPAGALPDWDALCWPARVGLVARTMADAPEDLHRAVLERVKKRKLTRRLRREIDAAVADVSNRLDEQGEGDERDAEDDAGRFQSGLNMLVGPYVPPPPGQADDESVAAAVDGSVPDWIRTLLDSPVYAAQFRTAGSRAPTQAQMVTLLSTLDQHGGRLSESVLASSLQVPAYRTGGMIAAARAVLNVDGAAILSADDASSAGDRTVRFDRRLLFRQFEIDA